MKPNRLILTTLIIFTQGASQWIQTAGPIAHRGVPLLTVFTTGDTLIVGAYRGGSYLSTNNGVTWEERNNGFPWYYDYTNVNDFLVENDWLIAATDNGVYRSSTFGEFWIESNAGFPASVGMDVFARLPGLISGGSAVGLYSSTNNGMSWFADTVGLDRTATGAVTYVWALATVGSTRFAGTANGVYISPAPGLPWQEANIGIPRPVGYCCHDRITSFHVSGQNVFAGTDLGSGILVSTNGGLSWTQRNNGLPGYPSGRIPAIRSLAESNGYMFASVQDVGVYRSSDNGANWVSANSGLPVQGYVTDMRATTRGLLATTFEGLFQTTNNGVNWTPVLTQFPVFMSTRAIISSDNQIFISAHCEHYSCGAMGVYRSSDQGLSWFQAIAPFTYVNKFVSRPGELYACTGGIYLSTDNGANWEPRSSGLPGYPVKDLAFHSSALVAALGYFFRNDFGGVFISTDGGLSWNSAGLSDQNVRAVVSSGDYILASATNFFAPSGVYRTSNLGQTWEQVTSGLPSNAYVYDFLARGGAVYAAAYQGAYVTTNSGSTWLAANSGFQQNTSVYEFVQTPSAILCATTTGIYVSTNEGSSWRLVNSGLSDITFTYSLTVSSDLVFVGTNQGVWRRPIDEIMGVSEPIVHQFVLYQNYPNPFNPGTVIAFQLPTSDFVRLKVYDILGREVATLFEGERPAGKHTVEWKPEGISGGIYTYRLTTSHATLAKKMIFLK